MCKVCKIVGLNNKKKKKLISELGRRSRCSQEDAKIFRNIQVFVAFWLTENLTEWVCNVPYLFSNKGLQLEHPISQS